jgi:hypothetical protein
LVGRIPNFWALAGEAGISPWIKEIGKGGSLPNIITNIYIKVVPVLNYLSTTP